MLIVGNGIIEELHNLRDDPRGPAAGHVLCEGSDEDESDIEVIKYLVIPDDFAKYVCVWWWCESNISHIFIIIRFWAPD